jgi:hypothetical protein
MKPSVSDLSLIDKLKSKNPLTRNDFIFFALTLALIHPAFILHLKDISPWDEAGYINSGRLLIENGNWPNLAYNPLVTMLYGLTYLPYRSSIFWMVQSERLAWPILFVLLWVSLCLVAKQLVRFASPLIALGIFLVTPLSIDMLRFPSDPLFAALAGLSFWKLLCFYNERNTKHLWWASLFMGSAAMARSDGLVLFPILIFLVVLLGIHAKNWLKALLAASLPFFVIIGGYVLFYGLRTGNFDTGIMARTYDNFEAGQGVLSVAPSVKNPIFQAQLGSRQLFGTPQENHNSIFNAIRRNPQAYVQRLVGFTKALPGSLLDAYGIRFAILLFLFVGRGIFYLLKARHYALLVMLCLWPIHLVSAFAITLVRTGHLEFPFYIIFCLAAIGISAMLANLKDKKEMLAWGGLLLAIAIWGVFDNKLAIYYGVFILLASLLAILAINRFLSDQASGWMPALSLTILLCAGLVIHGNFPSPDFEPLGKFADEQAVIYLVTHFPPGAGIGAAAPGPVWMAKMSYGGLVGLDVPENKTSDGFLQWMREQKIQAVYVDSTLYNGNDWLCNLLQAQIGKGLERVYEGDQGNIQILRLKSASSN